MPAELYSAPTPEISEDDFDAIMDLADVLPDGWIIEVEPVEMADAAFDFSVSVSHREGPKLRPHFMAFHSARCVGFAVTWPEGGSFSSAAFNDLATVLAMIPSGVFAFEVARLAPQAAEGWQEAAQ